MTTPSWPDENPRYTIDTQPTIRVLDRAYNHRIVKEYPTRTKHSHAHAQAVADKLNQDDEDA